MPPRSPAPTDGVQILTAANASPHTLDGTNTYLLGGPRSVVIDPGPDDAEHVRHVVDAARNAAQPIALILLTHGHADHVGAAARLVRETGAPVARWRGGDRPLEDGETVALDGMRLETLHTPGHAPDHLAFYWMERQLLFSGDLILGRGTVVISPPAGSMEDYLRSLDRVSRLDLAVVAPGHGPLIEDPAARIAEYIAHRRMRERQVLEALAGGSRTPGEIAGVIYTALDPRLHPAAEGQVQAHLAKLLHEGRVRRAGNRYYLP